MSIRISSLVWSHYPAGGSELLTALAYADHAHDDGTNIRPSVAYVAKKTRQSERSVRRYLAQMRESGWLLTVRHGNGGRGFATEYRVNPLWITNPDNLAPFTETTKTLTAETKKGDTRGIERMTRVSPQPLRTIKETERTEHAAQVDTLQSITGISKKNLVALFQHCPEELRQSVEDEVINQISAGKVRNPRGLLQKLINLAKEGQFRRPTVLGHPQSNLSEKSARGDDSERKGQRALQEILKKLSKGSSGGGRK